MIWLEKDVYKYSSSLTDKGDPVYENVKCTLLC